MLKAMLELVPIELRVSAGSGEPADVGNQLNLVRGQQVQKIFDPQRRVANSPDRDVDGADNHRPRRLRKPYRAGAKTASRMASSIASTFLFTALLLAGVVTRASGQDIAWRPAITGSRSSFRGLSVAPDGSIWIGGTQGTVIRSTDKGMTWSVDTVPGARSFDFRGVAAIDSMTVYLAVSSADTGRIYKTADGGLTWHLQYRDERKGVFFDGVACWSAQRCLVAGDPIAGRFVIIATDDGGAHWLPRDTATGPAARPGEAAFAASNSTLIVGSGGRAWLATGGGPSARVWRTSDYGLAWRMSETPIIAGRASAGIFSLAFCDVLHGIAVGGDYRAPDSTGAHVARTADGGETWVLADSSHVTPYLSGTACTQSTHGLPTFVSVGPAGSFRSVGGWRWERYAREALNAVASLSNGRLVAAGGNGTVVTAEQRAVAGTR